MTYVLSRIKAGGRHPSARKWLTAGVAAAMVAILAGCGGGDRTGRPGSVASQLNETAGERLGQTVAEHTEPGVVVLVNLSRVPDEANQWQSGLDRGLGGGYSVTLFGLEQMPPEASGVMGGFPALRLAMQQHSDAVAFITTLPIGAYERPSFPASHPPVFALAWSYLPDAVHMFSSGKLVAGIFDRPGRQPGRDMDASLSKEDLFDRNYVLATPENYREVAIPYQAE